MALNFSRFLANAQIEAISFRQGGRGTYIRCVALKLIVPKIFEINQRWGISVIGINIKERGKSKKAVVEMVLGISKNDFCRLFPKAVCAADNYQKNQKNFEQQKNPLFLQSKKKVLPFHGRAPHV